MAEVEERGGEAVETLWEGALRGLMTRCEACPFALSSTSSQEFECAG